MIVKMGIDLARGFEPWKEMFIKNEHRLNAHGGRLVFAGTEKDNDNKLTIIMDFALQTHLKVLLVTKNYLKLELTLVQC